MSDVTTPYGAPSKNATAASRKKVTPLRLADMRARGEKITMLTAYDATFAGVVGADPGTDTVLVGDSLGMVCQGHDSTLGVSLEAMRYHTECVARGLARVHSTALLVADLPFGSYHQGPSQAMASAATLMGAGAHMVKLEGGGWTAELVRYLVERGVPVCAHLGLTPQSVHAFSGFRVQGRGEADAQRMKQWSLELQDAGATLLVLEMVPAALSREITDALPRCHTIGIGAGSGCAGQVLVLHDMLGVHLGKPARFVKDFVGEAGSIPAAIAAFNAAVKAGEFPVDAEHAW